MKKPNETKFLTRDEAKIEFEKAKKGDMFIWATPTVANNWNEILTGKITAKTLFNTIRFDIIKQEGSYKRKSTKDLMFVPDGYFIRFWNPYEKITNKTETIITRDRKNIEFTLKKI